MILFFAVFLKLIIGNLTSSRCEKRNFVGRNWIGIGTAGFDA